LEAVLDKGYHSNEVLVTLKEWEVRTYCSEPKRGRRNWKDKAAERDAVYQNRRRIRGERGRKLLRQRGEKVERSFVRLYESGAMRRSHLRRHANIQSRADHAQHHWNRYAPADEGQRQGVHFGTSAVVSDYWAIGSCAAPAPE
jgi:hypothetical protein